MSSNALLRDLSYGRAAGGLPGIAKLVIGLVRCKICTRKMAPGSAALADHPRTVNLRKDVVVAPINEWLCQVFHPENRDETVQLLTGSQDGRVDSRRAAAEKRMKDAEAKLRRHLAAIEADVDPVNFVEPTKRAQPERQAATEELKHLPDTQAPDVAEVYPMPDHLGNVERHLNSRSPERITQVYPDLGLQVFYDNKKRRSW
ncbi:hypothetical protein AB0C38_13555 [Amycolatopsis sp. NPDC048633]|uniref:hypothetical protein n=1 Tax=Amycolatopsis sp. NPDC048633 TaxID=3157095 RepID=UPI0033FA173C